MSAIAGVLIRHAADGGVTASVILAMQLSRIMGLSNTGGEVLYSGSAPGLVVGVIQLNFRVPKDAPVAGSVPLELKIDTAYRQPVSLAIGT